MTLTDRIIDAVIAHGPDSVAARALRDILDEAVDLADWEDDKGEPVVPELERVVARARLLV